MESLLYSFFAGSSTALGAIILMLFGKPGRKTMAALLGFAGGIMIAVSLFELMPEAYELGESLFVVVAGFILGCGMMYLLDVFLPHAHMSTSDELIVENASHIHEERKILRTGYLIFFGIALHNVPEGLAIGAGLEASPELGMSIALAIGLHNIPEGLAVAGPLKAGGLSSLKVILFTLGAGLMTVVGTTIGLVVFGISTAMIGGSLAFAAGAMIYIVNDELVPQANGLHSHLANAGIIAGTLIGFAMLL
ncbi:ZIP family metal transporter [Alkalibacter saccharofermentans]|uniref:Zinc transporter, ZIP family n=1 Tax=Alkalibacter saccharofermentans DSM 14828 TaxID=1120975 RepID=A0A1M4ZST9_9FIRM|nr:ZIP family metal transporter [Alkalibacter saccharofermentans]SHF21160.1 zinc transporter, ZIP family [Alkalibacter saccharofermentans DSM 14828]